MIAMMESTIIQLRTFVWVSTSGKNGKEKRMKPYVPIFSRTPARITEPAVGASTCASGSQVWNGNIGTLMANARKKAPNSQKAAGPSPPRGAGRYAYENEEMPVWWPTSETSTKMATRINSEPKNV